MCNYSHMDIQLIGTREAAERLSVDRSTLVRWIHRGYITPAGRIANTYFFDPRELNEVLRQTEKEVTA